MGYNLLITTAARSLLGGTQEFYVGPTGSNVQQNGTLSGAPWLTIQYAINQVAGSYIFQAGATAVINIADGTYAESITLVPYLSADNSNTGAMVLNGNAGTPGNVVIAPPGGNNGILGLDLTTPYTIQNLRINAPGAIGLIADRDSTIFISGTVQFGSAATQIQAQYGSMIELLAGSTTVLMGTSFEAFAAVDGIILGQTVGASRSTIQFSGGPSYNWLCVAVELGLIDLSNSIFSGSFTGSQFRTSYGLVIGGYTYPGTAGANSGFRTVLTAPTTYYVRATGNDNNTGLANTNAAAFATLEYAYEFVLEFIDTCGFPLTINVGDGTYTEGVSVTAPLVGGGALTFLGDPTTPTNCVLNVTGDGFAVYNGASVNISGFLVEATGNAIHAVNGQISVIGNMNYGASAAHMLSEDGGLINVLANYAISGAATSHTVASVNGSIVLSGLTVTGSGALAFAGGFVSAFLTGVIEANGMTFSGTSSFIGPRYSANGNGVIYTNGGGATYFPGNSGGATANGGQYL